MMLAKTRCWHVYKTKNCLVNCTVTTCSEHLCSTATWLKKRKYKHTKYYITKANQESLRNGSKVRQTV